VFLSSSKKLRMHLMQLILTHWITDALNYGPLFLMDSHEVHPHLVTCQWLSSMIEPVVLSLRLAVVNRPVCIGALGPFHQKIDEIRNLAHCSVSSARWWTESRKPIVSLTEFNSDTVQKLPFGVNTTTDLKNVNSYIQQHWHTLYLKLASGCHYCWM